MFWLRNKKIKFSFCTLNLSPDNLLQLLEAANSLFEAKCPAAFTTGKKFEDFEGESNDYVYGELVRDVEPFSGRKSIRNPKKIYPAKTGQGDIRMLGWSDFYVSIHIISIFP